MMTSNKILIGFFTLVFLLPLFMFMTFKKQIKKGRFTEQSHNEFYGNKSHGKGLAPYKAVKIISPINNVLSCVIRYTGKPGYSYSNFGQQDSVQVQAIGDTLLVKYLPAQLVKHGAAQSNSATEIFVTLTLPAVEYLLIDNAEVSIASTDTMAGKTLVADITNKGRLNIGTSSAPDEEPQKPATAKPSYTTGHLSLTVHNATIAVKHQVHIEKLSISTTGQSTVNIKSDATIGTVEGRLSDETTVNASWLYFKNMLPLAATKNK
jgi:hypothetical protein